jgi:hypothetical protein
MEPVQLRISDFRADSLEDSFDPYERALFIDIPSAPEGQAIMTLDLSGGLSDLELAIDLDKDGIPDQIMSPTSIVNQTQIQDLIAPTSTVSITGTLDTLGFYTGLITVTVSAYDADTSVLSSQYSLNGGQTWQTYTDPLVFLAEQVPIFQVRSMDIAGNQEVPWLVIRLRPYALYLPVTQRQ